MGRRAYGAAGWDHRNHLRDEPAAERVRHEWLESGAANSVNLGEAMYMEMRPRGTQGAGSAIEKARRELAAFDPDWKLVVSAAETRADGRPITGTTAAFGERPRPVYAEGF